MDNQFRKHCKGAKLCMALVIIFSVITGLCGEEDHVQSSVVEPLFLLTVMYEFEGNQYEERFYLDQAGNGTVTRINLNDSENLNGGIVFHMPTSFAASEERVRSVSLAMSGFVISILSSNLTGLPVNHGNGQSVGATNVSWSIAIAVHESQAEVTCVMSDEEGGLLKALLWQHLGSLHELFDITPGEVSDSILLSLP